MYLLTFPYLEMFLGYVFLVGEKGLLDTCMSQAMFHAHVYVCNIIQNIFLGNNISGWVFFLDWID